MVPPRTCIKLLDTGKLKSADFILSIIQSIVRFFWDRLVIENGEWLGTDWCCLRIHDSNVHQRSAETAVDSISMGVRHSHSWRRRIGSLHEQCSRESQRTYWRNGETSSRVGQRTSKRVPQLINNTNQTLWIFKLKHKLSYITRLFLNCLFLFNLVIGDFEIGAWEVRYSEDLSNDSFDEGLGEESWIQIS